MTAFWLAMGLSIVFATDGSVVLAKRFPRPAPLQVDRSRADAAEDPDLPTTRCEWCGAEYPAPGV
jgi:hypothetical protein